MTRPYINGDNAYTVPVLVKNTAGVRENHFTPYRVLKWFSLSNATIGDTAAAGLNGGFVPGPLRRVPVIRRLPANTVKEERALRRFFDIAVWAVRAESLVIF